MTSVNSFFRSVLDDLIEKRLWPFAVGLLILLIAIPLLLSKSAEEQPAAAPAPAASPALTGGGALSAFEPVVNTEGKKSSEIRKNLTGFQSKDPFKPQNLGGGGGSSSAAGSVTVQGGEGSPAGSSVGGAAATGGGASGDVSDNPPLGTSGGGSGDGSSTESQTFYYTYTADVRFGKEDNLDRKTLQQFRSLPSSEDPVLVFMGVKQDGETAIFLQSSTATSTGEGDCEPDDTCTFLYMKPGEEQLIEAVNANNEVITYKLVLLDIDVKRTKGPEKAQTSSSRSKRSKRSREAAKKRGNPFARGFQAIRF